MADIVYLTEEEQFKEVLNKDEIKRIKDPILKELREKYWLARCKVVLTEGVKDDEITTKMQEISKEELEALENYKKENK